MCIREIPSRRIDCFFFAKVYDNQGPIARGSYQPPSTALAKVAKYGSWARVKFIHCCGHCIHFVISVNDMPPSNLNIKRDCQDKTWGTTGSEPPTRRHLCHKSDALTITLLRTLQDPYSKDSGNV